ncbi:hypothetical protein TrST_g12879 [Triparma strigata]|uniref:Uncharacterized protein n=1 Tax=Triparma strigata TaxID=1606541 RepID=A0A9W7E561_9STRA|nr:hypothetical protein TrST_g12879 [Triparma strigata]
MSKDKKHGHHGHQDKHKEHGDHHDGHGDHAEFEEEEHHETFVHTQTDHDDHVRGMKRKWDRHYYGAASLISKCCCMSGILLGVVTGLLWSQFLYIWGFDQNIMFRMVLDQNDQWSKDPMYMDFIHREVEPQTSLFSFYLWNVTNPEIVMRDGFKPVVREAGPYGYVKNVYKYDVQFSTDDSEFVTYKQYSFFTPTPTDRDCYQMFFAMDKAKYSSQNVDCIGDTCDCRDDEGLVTVINPKFFQLMEKWKPAGVMGLLSREIFAEYRDAFTTQFVDSIKFTFLPDFFTLVYNFRNCNFVGITYRNLLDKLIAEHGEAWTVQSFRNSHLQDQLTDTVCGEFSVPTDKSVYCPFGSGNFIASFAQSNIAQLTDTEAKIVLGLDPAWPNATPFGSGEAGMKRWYNAAVYMELIPIGVLDIADLQQLAEDSYTELVAECMTWDGELVRQHCEWKIKGICELMFNMWTWSQTNKDKVHTEWRDSPVDTVSCDTLGNTCGWEVGPYDTQGLNLDVIQNIIDPMRAASWNYLSLYKEENMNNFKDIYDHCVKKETGQPYQCPSMRSFEDLAATEYPQHFNNTYLQSGSSAGYTKEIFFTMGCDVSKWIFDAWGKNSVYVKRSTAAWYNQRWYPDDSMYGAFNETNLHMLGYAQWGNGAPTKLLFRVPSVTNIKRFGIWRFSRKGTQLKLPEFYARGQKWAYPKMNMTTFQAKEVLDALAEDSVEAYEFRRNLIHKGTTEYGTGGELFNGFGLEGDVSFIKENPFANFTLPYHHKYHKLSKWLDEGYMSGADLCPVVEKNYHDCMEEVEKYKQFWPTRCGEWMTLNLDPAFGIQCNNVRIWSQSHPWPKKNGNLLESVITEVMWEEVMKKGLLTCANPSYVQEPNGPFEVSCSYDKGGMFIKQKARDILFEGFTDPFVIKVMNAEFSMLKRGFQIVCNKQEEITYLYDCTPMMDPQCGEEGFSVIHETDGVLANMTRNTREWYLHEIDLGPVHGKIDSPVFATYLGQLWKDSGMNTNTSDPDNKDLNSRTVQSAIRGSMSAKPNFNTTENIIWQKERTCAKRYMGGPAGVYPNCTITMETGRNELNNLGRVTNYFGNSSIYITPSSSFMVDGNQISDGAYNNYFPFLWEGFRSYDLQYRSRASGLSYKGNSSLKLFVGDELLQFRVPNVEAFDGKKPTKIKWPKRYRFYDNTTAESEVMLLRYQISKEGWQEAADLAHDLEYDYYGMPYKTPIGMSSTRSQTGFSTTIGTPHHYGNAFWGGGEWIQFRGLDPNEINHATRFDVEPLTGTVMRIAKRFQINIRVERGPLMDNIISSQERCVVPTKSFNPNGAGCFIYFPLLWYDDQRIYERAETKKFVEEYLTRPQEIMLNTSFSVTFAFFVVVMSTLGWLVQWKKWRTFKARIFLD